MIVKDQLDNWDDKNIGRKREWFSLDKARELLAVYKPVSLLSINHSLLSG